MAEGRHSVRIMKTLRALLIVGAVTATVGAATATAAPVRGAHFTSPSRNIDCRIDPAGPASVTCYVKRDRWRSTKPKPRSCRLAWFPTEVRLVQRTTRIGGCRGDIGPMCLRGNPCTVLRYGKRITVKSIRCTSTTTGVTCRRTTGRRQGFKIARERVTVYR